MALNPFLNNLAPSYQRDTSNKNSLTRATVPPDNQVKIGDFTFPGISKVEVTRERKTRIQTKKTGSKDNVIDSGVNLARVTIRTSIYWQPYDGVGNDPNQNMEFSAMEKMVDFFENKLGIKSKGKTMDSFPIINPITRVRRVMNVYVESITGPINDPIGRQDWIFNCIEVGEVKDDKPKTNKPKSRKVKITSAVDPSFSDIVPSQDPQKTQPRKPKSK